jgi:D-beta-D-heptose 7-phosphate kinase / D-beta-D-heptose 1-phosphate adenosyltransferase
MDPDLFDLISKFRGARVLVVGDVMLDRFVYGQAERISPEAPIPVLTIEREIAMPGGAGNVARNVASLGGEAVLIGLSGRDRAGDTLSELLAAEAGITDAIVRSAARPTTEKIRYIADRQQILRADNERRLDADDDAPALLTAFRQHLAAVDTVVFSDYAKGVLCNAFIAPAMEAARAAGKPVVVDPKSANLARYAGATILTPNIEEAAAATGLDGASDDAASACARAVLDAVPGLEAALVTRGRRGMTLAERGVEVLHIPARSREVFDVSGAGDTAVAALTLALAAGASMVAAASLANVAAGVAVTGVGTAAVSAADVAAELQAQRIGASEAKIVSLPQGIAAAERWRAKGERVGFTNGCFDLIHPGHVSLLAQARAECDQLIVGLNTDASIRRLKGDSRPIQDEAARSVVLASLAVVDLVIPFPEDTPEALIRALRPDVLVKGADYTIDQVVGADFVRSYGGKVFLAKLVQGKSTSGIIWRVGREGGA